MAKYKQRKDGRYQTSVTIDKIKQYVSANSSDELDKKVTELKYLGNKEFTEMKIVDKITYKEFIEDENNW